MPSLCALELLSLSLWCSLAYSLSLWCSLWARARARALSLSLSLWCSFCGAVCGALLSTRVAHAAGAPGALQRAGIGSAPAGARQVTDADQDNMTEDEHRLFFEAMQDQ